MSDTEFPSHVVLHCGWGRLLFAHTFPDPQSVAAEVMKESAGQRDIAFYLTDPHIVLNCAPQDLFLDPSDTYRLDFKDYTPSSELPGVFEVVPVESREDLVQINRIYQSHNMVPVNVDFVLKQREDERFKYWIARSTSDREILGAVMSVDHMSNFADIENGSSLWALAVDSQCGIPGIGEFLVRHVVEYYKEKGRAQLDLSVMHDNRNAIKLYKKLGFTKVAVFAVKCRNAINERLFVGEPMDEGYNPYASIIIQEALRRGISVDRLQPAKGYFRLGFGGRNVTCRESLSEMTSAVAMSRCDDKALTRELLAGVGLSVPEQEPVENEGQAGAFLETNKHVVVKPVRGEQGHGVSVDLTELPDVIKAIEVAKKYCDDVVLEAFKPGKDLRIIVINNEVVAAALRLPPTVVGTGNHRISDLINRLSRRREAATGGESAIPVDDETKRCVKLAGYSLEDVLPDGELVQVRKTANLHTGGTIHDVTAELNAQLASAALKAAEALEIPVVGLDFIVPSVSGTDYVIIEANERPGLANHEPQPTAEKFVDFLFPQTIKLADAG